MNYPVDLNLVRPNQAACDGDANKKIHFEFLGSTTKEALGQIENAESFSGTFELENSNYILTDFLSSASVSLRTLAKQSVLHSDVCI